MTKDRAKNLLAYIYQPTLQQLFRGTHILVLLITLIFSGTSLSILAFFALDDYAKQNLHLMASSVSYRVEAGVVFNDRLAIQDTINQLTYHHELSQIKVFDQHHNILAENKPNPPEQNNIITRLLNRLFFSNPVVELIEHDKQKIGSVWIVGNAAALTHFLGQVALGMTSCLIITMLAVSYFSRRSHAYIMNTINKMTNVANMVREQRAFNLRLPYTQIVELNELSEDFNSLLDEIEQWHKHIKAENASLTYKAMHDSLTGLANRNYFEAQLENLFIQSKVSAPLALLFIDNNRFKAVNDTYGHAVGDKILIETAKRLQSRLREKDFVARLGGDEFAVILPRVGSLKNAEAVCKAIISAIETPVVLPNGEEIYIKLSIGIAISTQCRTPQQLLAHADAAMYQAKLTSDNSWFVFNQSLIE